MEREREFETVVEVPAINDRIKYLTKYLDGTRSKDNKMYTKSVLLFSLFIEHVSLFSQFLIMMSFNKNNNVLKGISNVVEATSKGEKTHGRGTQNQAGGKMATGKLPTDARPCYRVILSSFTPSSCPAFSRATAHTWRTRAARRFLDNERRRRAALLHRRGRKRRTLRRARTSSRASAACPPSRRRLSRSRAAPVARGLPWRRGGRGVARAQLAPAATAS